MEPPSKSLNPFNFVWRCAIFDGILKIVLFRTKRRVFPFRHQTQVNHFGEHLMIDGYGGSFEKLNDKGRILACLNDLCEKLGMKMLCEPEVYMASGNGKKDPGGWSGFVVIFESHISIHTFPEKRFLSADVYTCRNGMNTEVILKFLEEAFDLKEIERNFVKRGLRYPI